MMNEVIDYTWVKFDVKYFAFGLGKLVDGDDYVMVGMFDEEGDCVCGESIDDFTRYKNECLDDDKYWDAMYAEEEEGWRSIDYNLGRRASICFDKKAWELSMKKKYEKKIKKGYYQKVKVNGVMTTITMELAEQLIGKHYQDKIGEGRIVEWNVMLLGAEALYRFVYKDEEGNAYTIRNRDGNITLENK